MLYTIEFSKVLPQDLYDRLDEYIDSLNIDKKDRRRKGHLIGILHKAQKLFGYLPEEVQKHIANRTNIYLSHISGVISFYNFFTTTPKGKYTISICMGTACYVKGAGRILEEFERFLNIKAGEVTDDKKYSIDVLRCVGACGLAPVVMVNDKVYGNVTVKMVGGIMADCMKEERGE